MLSRADNAEAAQPALQGERSVGSRALSGHLETQTKRDASLLLQERIFNLKIKTIESFHNISLNF